ncbi:MULTISPECIES: hypothetical protein [Rhizobium]|jgi:hypothetical protein|uniref:hypothetical protein n=1 Tax=Rhizobium TaxID=379 RepID=UPI00041D7110|nr:MULTISPECIES: hypothetical protein [Rhizobium]MBB3300262.1 hypothetical protein [Rhizobium sp. BK112]MBB3370022.1 hypothetical protein [Rhizobium sp. BK077]MBB3746318.1 hypothetical protein [Rhizobium sp. BK591]MBB4115318.1 hypothetical protein [Rhizobium sp. BK226]MBB4180153.1 hypothetical protein [Rhizobium sp. BK109]
MKKAPIASAVLLLDTMPGPIETEIDVGLPPHGALACDLPVADTASLKRFG